MNKDTILNEVTYKTTRSSGPGGQHANKVSSKVVLYFDLLNSEGLNLSEKSLLTKSLAPRLTQENVLIISCEDSRSQFQNKEKVIKKLLDTLTQGLKQPKKRIPTKPTKSSKNKKLDTKKHRGTIKALRKNPPSAE